MTLADIAQERQTIATRLDALKLEEHKILRARVVLCQHCSHGQRVHDTDRIYDLEFRCPGQTGGTFYRSGSVFVCNGCGRENNLHSHPEIEPLADSVFRSVKERETP